MQAPARLPPLPLTTPQPPPADAPERPRVLIIEDEAPLSHALTLKLTREGFVVTVAADGREGLALAARGGYGVILLDLTLPEVDGFAVLQAQRARKSKVPVVVLTNMGNEEVRRRAEDMGAAAFFMKANTSLADVVRIVKRFCR